MLASKRRHQTTPQKVVNPTSPGGGASQHPASTTTHLGVAASVAYKLNTASIASTGSGIESAIYLKSDLTKVVVLSTIAISLELGLKYLLVTYPSLLRSIPYLNSLKF